MSAPPPLRVLIVGASSGLGRALALAYAKYDRAHLVIAARRAKLLDQVAKEAYECGASSVLAVKADVTVEKEAQQLIRKAADQLGCIDILILNAGIMGWSCLMETEACALDDMNKALMDTNFYGVVYPLKAAIPYIRDQWQSCTRVAITSAMAALAVDRECLKQPLQTLFASSKLAIEGFVKSVRLEECFPLLVAYPAYICDTEHYTRMLYPSDYHSKGEPLLHLAQNPVTAETAAYRYRYGIQEQQERIFLDEFSKMFDVYHSMSDIIAHFIQCFLSQPLDTSATDEEQRVGNELPRVQIPPEFMQPIAEFYKEKDRGVEDCEKTVKGMLHYLNNNSTAKLFHMMQPAQRESLANAIVNMQTTGKE